MTHHNPVVSMAHAIDVPVPLIGPKAMSLVHLSHAKLPVPPAFFITAEAYREHIRDNGIVTDIDALLAGDTQTPDDLARLRDRITESPLSDSLADEITHAVSRLKANHLAIRSSGTAEDLPGHSFAGLHDTFLGPGDPRTCLDAVRKCWASLWTHRAFEYRKANNFDHRNIAMAVIVQELIDADASGVVFTANPLTGRTATITLEACFGLGETLVGGKITPDHFTFDKDGFRLMGSLPGNKSIASRLDGSGGTKEVPLNEAQATTLSVKISTARRIARLAHRAEQVFGSPQDIEWAVKGRKRYLLQSRPITTRPKELSWEDRQIWTNLNLGEVAPDVLTPATESITLGMLDRMFGIIFNILCVDPREYPIVGLVAGRLYWNVNSGVAVFGHLPTMKATDFDVLFGGKHVDLYRTGRLDLAREDIPPLKGSFAKVLLRLPLTFRDIYKHRFSRAKTVLETLVATNEHLKNLDVPNVSTQQCRDTLNLILNEILAGLDLMSVLTSIYALPLTYRLTELWLNDKHGRIASQLFMGLGGMADAEAGRALWQLARIARAHPDIERAIDAGESWGQTQPVIASLPTGDVFLTAWDAFLAEYGHHCRGEIELYNPRWSETPDYCLDMVRSYIRCLGEQDPDKHLSETAAQRQRALEQCRKQLRNPLKRWLLTYFIRTAIHGSIFRENCKDQVVRIIAVGRSILLELGRRLVEQGVLTETDDIFFLHLDRIEPLLEGSIPADLKQTIADRRRQYEKFSSINPPNIVIGRFDPDNFTPDTVDDSATVLHGISVSSGVATGKARVIGRLDSDSHIQPGEILVAPFTDPGWAPYFLPAAAIVMDQGGLLSHGSILAREYGIPAVVNVGPATHIIKTGQTITVDADHALVRILD